MQGVTQISFETYRGDAAENYERYFVPAIGAPVADDLLERAALQPGERVVDVACGTGVIARLAAERVGTEGAVTGVDINPGMLAVARSEPIVGATVEWYEARAEELPFANASFDAALCQLGLQFFEDRATGLREMRRVLRPGGRCVASVPGSAPDLFAAAEEAVERYLGSGAAGFLRLVFSIRGERELRELFRAAGFDDVEVQITAKRLRLPAPQEFVWQYVFSTPLAAAAPALDDRSRTQLEREVVDAWTPFTQNGSLVLDLEMAVASGRRP
jgi:ubiquinone/menaquinone biosynthesis C-methylase UbiE